MDLTTLVATVDRNGVSRERLRDEIQATLDRLGVRLVPCDWAPDPDTIVECTNADHVDVVDLNPPMR